MSALGIMGKRLFYTVTRGRRLIDLRLPMSASLPRFVLT